MFGSGFDALTFAVLVIVLPAGAVTFTTSLTATPVGFAIVNCVTLPTLQVTVPFVNEQGVGGVDSVQLSRPLLLVHEPAANSALTKVVPLGSVSVTTTPLAMPGPKFTTAI